MGSLAELETQFLLSERLGFVPQDQKDELLKRIDDVGKVVMGLIRYVSNK